MVTKLKKLESILKDILGKYLQKLIISLNEITIIINAIDYYSTMKILRDHINFKFEQLIDLCGIDYSVYNQNINYNSSHKNLRFAIVSHLLSLNYNWRLRVRVFAENNELPKLHSITSLWSSANWYEREAFDLFGIFFDGHNDLRRLLTDYGFLGHPFRKDFPVIGYVEMKYNTKKSQIIYQPVTIESRENYPRIIKKNKKR
ncbi:NADH-quinone oxidoreductase subunit C [Candidatus Profftella armatura (Diaphorina cf. continua)]|uniref:NADH-quinone oxidoreductase subunit C n=1 Tax=Candidatus Profftella armatura (Diaphorina cf. continua) TaxID=2661583 RepID=A0A7R6VZX2_9PROT|nr:NADH-quinone oxidoreductase subunit C [Candidatus Profftella armatura (Diaphorina cf. continua)]BCG49528.1 NADH-quinone oxidoreductase subunit C [Candidatus Profftella armatura (Diaphorina cf. continua)]